MTKIRTSDGVEYTYAGTHQAAQLVELVAKGHEDTVGWVRVASASGKRAYVQVSQITLVANDGDFV